MLERIWALRTDNFDQLLIAYGDTFIDLNLDEFVAHHESTGSTGTIVTAEIKSPFGLIDGGTQRACVVVQGKTCATT